MNAKILPILIIEDDHGLNELLCEIVQELGYQSYSCYSAGDAIDWLKTQTPLLMLLDFSLPDLNGKEFILKLQSNGMSLPPFIMATGRGDERIAVEMMKLGAKDYVIKDANFLEMIELILGKLIVDIENEQNFLNTKKELDELSVFSNQVIDSVQEGIEVYDKDLNYRVWNPYMEELTGVKAADVIGKRIHDVFPFLENAGLVSNVLKSLAGESDIHEIQFYYEIPETGKSGWVASLTSYMKNSEGEIIGAMSSVRDITESKNAEQALLESEKKYRTLVEDSPDAIAIYVDGIIKMVNQQCLKLMNVTNADELIGKSMFAFIHPDSRDVVLTRMSSTEKAGVLLNPVEEKFVRPDGSEVDVNVKAMSLKMGDELAVQLIIRDISERKKAEREIAENRIGLQKILLASTEFIESSSENINYSKICEMVKSISNAKFVAFNLYNEFDNQLETVGLSCISGLQNLSKKYLGYNLLGKKWSNDTNRLNRIKDNTITEFQNLKELSGDIISDKMLSIIEHSFNFGTTYVVKIARSNVYIGDFTLFCKKGLKMSQPELVELFANQIALFIERKRAEHGLKANEKKYRILFADNPQPMMIYDLETLEYIEVNQAACKLYGYSHEEFMSLTVNDVHPASELPYLYENIEDIRRYDTPKPDLEFQHKKKTGELFYVQISSHSMIMNKRKARHVLVIDITERKKAETELQNKMDELIRFQHVTVDRELAMIELKKEINNLLVGSGLDMKYKIVK